MSEKKGRKIVGKSVLIALGIICIVLVASLTVSIAVYTSIIHDRDSTISSLNSKVSGLQTQVDELLNQTVQSSLYYDEFGSVSIVSRSYDFSPPVSMYDALRIALESDGWNASSLSDKMIRVSLQYIAFMNTSGLSVISDLTQSAKDYSSVQVNGTTYRYVWTIYVVQSLYVPTGLGPGHLFGIYYVDSASGEIVPHGQIF
jgi:hypothetical protein